MLVEELFEGKCDRCGCTISSRGLGYVGRVDVSDEADRFRFRRHYCWWCMQAVVSSAKLAGAQLTSREITPGGAVSGGGGEQTVRTRTAARADRRRSNRFRLVPSPKQGDHT